MVYLKLVLGCMFSSKTTYLISEINRYKHITDKILVVNNILDKDRYNDTISFSFLKTHDEIKKCPAIMINTLSELKENHFYKQKYEYAEIIVIDEGQFFSDLYFFIKDELFTKTNKKMFIVAGLSGDYKMEPIGDMIKLVPLADEIKKLSAYCIYCKDGTLASFTCKLSDDTSQILVGASTIYSPCCRYHYLTFSKYIN
jgi:thymidine kinase